MQATAARDDGRFDAIVVGTGFGGAMAAHRLIEAGWRVLVLERGPWVPRGPYNADPAQTVELTPYYSKESFYRVLAGGYEGNGGAIFCVGGPSVFYGGASLRFRQEDFAPNPEIAGDSGAGWPYRYADLEPYYSRAERLLAVSGDDASDPTRPARSTPLPYPPAPLAGISERFRDAARSLGLNPFPLPLAINFAPAADGRKPCTSCRACDTFACSIEAKNDIAVAILGPLLGRGLELRDAMVVTGLAESRGRIEAVKAWDMRRNESVLFRGRHVILAAGALASPHLLLASGLDRLNPAAGAVGRYLIRHCSAMIFGFCNFRPDPDRVFHKQIAVHDYYFGDPGDARLCTRRLGSIQQITTPPEALMKAHLPGFIRPMPLGGFLEHLASALVISEDGPRADNGVSIDPADRDRFGLPRLCVSHCYTPSELMRCRVLIRRAKRILRRAGAWSFHTHILKTFSHAMGTVRMGADPRTSPLDGDCGYRGIENLLVVDGSALPTAAAVNPSLTIAANALRAADRLVKRSSNE